MTQSWRSEIPSWLSMETAREIARGYKPHPTDGAPVLKGTVQREPRQRKYFGEEERRFRARLARDCFGPNILVEWSTGDLRGNNWTLKLPAEQILKLAEWILEQEPNRKAWWEWLERSDKVIKEEARAAGIEADAADVRYAIEQHRETLTSSGSVVDLSRLRKERR